MSTPAVPQPPPPDEPLLYPLVFASTAAAAANSAGAAITGASPANPEDDGEEEEEVGGGADRSRARQSGALSPAARTAGTVTDVLDETSVTLFNALRWLRPLYELAGWLPKPTRGGATTSNDRKGASSSSPSPPPSKESEMERAKIPFEDVRVALELLPEFSKFFVEQSNIIPQHTELNYYIESFTFPTPKGPKTLTRSKVEGDYRAVHQPSHAPPPGSNTSVAKTTVTNSTAVFSLLPGHNQFLLYYESVEKLKYFDYVQLDMLRFAWVAMRDLMEDSKVFNRNDGSITGFARRDLKKANAVAPWAEGERDSGSAGSPSPSPAGASGGSAAGAGAGGGGSKAPVGRGGGNARLHQGTSGNVIVGPSKEVLESKREMQQKRFLREHLEEECQRRWPHTPVHKSCVFSVEEKQECDLPPEVLQQLGVGASNARNNKNGARRGPRYFLGCVELPLVNKKGPPAKFRAERWWMNRKDAENAAAEAALTALRTMKSS